MSRLLIVDDDADILEALLIVLQDRHEITTAQNGLEAFGLLQARPFDAIVLDLMMPLMDGETLIERMREAAISVPVVLTSACSDVARLAVRLGVEHLHKPYDISSLEEKLARLVSAAQIRLG